MHIVNNGHILNFCHKMKKVIRKDKKFEYQKRQENESLEALKTGGACYLRLISHAAFTFTLHDSFSWTTHSKILQ